MFNPFSFKFRKGQLSFCDFFAKNHAEKLHQKFLKYILGVHTKTTNIAVLSELGRFPLYYNIIKAMLKYYYRLEKSQSTFPLLYDAFIESKGLSDVNKLSWFSSIDVIIKKMQSSRPVHNPNSRINDKTLYNYFINDWEQNLAQHSNGKLCTYVTFKTNFGCEKYLSIISSFDLRRCLSRLRLSAHALRIERGRYQGTPRHNRTCPRCDSGEVEDEKHFLFNCNSLILQQSKLLSCIDANCTQFKTLDNKNKLIWLMNSENKDVLLELCNFIKNNEKHT